MLTAALALAVELLERGVGSVPYSVTALVLVAATAMGAYLGGTWSGLWAAAVAVVYSAWALSEPGVPFRYAPEALVRLVAAAAVAFLAAVLVGGLRQRLTRQTARAAELEALLGAPEEPGSLGRAFDVLFRRNPQPMWVYDLETLRFLAVNRAAVEKYGYTEQEFLAMRITDIRPEEDVPRLVEALSRQRPGLQHSGLWRHRTKDGKLLDVEVHSHLLEFGGRPAALVVAHDVTERLRAERASRESEELFRTLVEQSLVGVYLIQDGVFRYVNPALAEIFGYRREELVERLGPRDLTYRPDWPLVEDSLRRRLAGEVRALRYGFRGVRKDGRVIHVEVYGARTLYEGRPAILGTLVDVTERVEAEAALRKLTQELEERVQERTAQLEAANRELEAFSYSVAHDLRAPLRSIDGFSQALLEDYGQTLDEVGKDYLRRVRVASQRMAELIDDLLQLSRIARQPLQARQVDLSSLVRRIADDLKQREPQRAVDLRVQPGVRARADAKLVEVALRNLLENAWKFTGRRSQAVVEFGVLRTPHGLACFVRDNGVGFDMRYADKLFAPFQRLHKPSEFPGTGIGLAIVQRAVARHGGRVWAQAAPEAGATFYFTLPGVEVQDGTPQADPPGGGQP